MSDDFEKVSRNAIMIPSFCERHQHILLVRKLHIPESGPWRATVVVANILVFQWVTGEGRIWKRLPEEERTPKDTSLILAEIGCLACFSGEAFRRAVLVLRKGLSHAAQVSQMKRSDPDWPIEQFKTKED